MEEHEKNHILDNLDTLVRTTFCRSIFMAQLVANGVLGLDDIHIIDSIPNDLQKSLTFYKLIVTRENSYGLLLEALNETSQSGAAQVLKQLYTSSSSSQPESSATKARNRVRKFLDGDQNQLNHKKTKEDLEREAHKSKPVIFDVRPPVQLFTGRQQELLELHDKLQESQTNGITTVVSQMASVTGLGGIGKTELCRRYIQEHGNHYDGNIIWITAEKEEIMQESFLRLAKDVLQLSLKTANGDSKEITTIVDEVYNCFSDKRSLFIFDNAESGEHLEKFMPFRVSQKPHILISSRDRDWEFEVDVMILHELDEEDAINFVKKGLGIKPQDTTQNEIILQLVTTLQRFPLTLQQAISFIKQQRMIIDYDIHMYLKAFEANAKTLLDSKIPAGSFNSYKRTTFTTWRMTTERIAADEDYGPLAIKILNRISYLGADNIPRSILLGLGEEEHEVLFALRLLVKYSMLESQPKEGTLSIHRLVQEVTRIELKTDEKDEVTIQDLLQVLEKNCASVSAVEHSIVAWNYGIKYPKLVHQFSNFPIQVTKQLFALERYNEANSFGNKGLLTLKEANLDENHVDIFKIKFQLTKVDYGQGKYNHSLEIFRDMVGQARKTIGELDPYTIEMEQYVGLALNKQGKYRESLEIFREVLEKVKTVYGEDDARCLGTILNLAINVSALGEYKEALDLYENIIKKYKRLLGDNNRQVFLATQNMALVYRAIGQLDKATEILKGVYVMAKTTMENDTLTFLVGHNLALYLLLQGNHEEAYEVATHVFERRKEILGPEHSETLSTSNVLGKLLRCQGKYEEALLIHQNVYQKLAKSCGKSHPHTLSAKLDISYIWSAIGMKEEALVSLQEVLESQMTKLGPNNHQTLATQVEIAKVLEQMQRFEEAKRLLEEVEGKIKANFGEEHSLLPGIRQFIQEIETNFSNLNEIDNSCNLPRDMGQ
ncbi:unnamed protein product [Orchesella dallaii]|uniref:NB-ARC domain-containing protein n=1 Tax=Orchesella dallaii TaxID=48710 RepID=A0ABP1RIA9_9HEXA